MKKGIKNIQASILTRLKNKAKEINRPFSEILQYYGMERFLFRFSQSKYAGKFILKGALMFTVWHVPERRTTLDIDFSARFDNQIASIERVIKDICKIPVALDGLMFDPKTIKGQKIKENAEYEGVRVKFRGFLGRARISMQIDVAFSDSIYPKPMIIDYPAILDLPRPHLKGYPVESVVSEKFEAMVKLGLLNSRMKDFYDIWLLMRQFDFNGSELAKALKRTFEHRKTRLPTDKPLFTEEIYAKTSDRQTLWNVFLKRGDITHAPKELCATARAIEEFLIKPLEAIKNGQNFSKNWKAPGLWE